MIKQLERTEVLQRVRFANKFYSPSQDLIYKSDESKNFKDLEIIRFDRRDWVEVHKDGDLVYFSTLEEYKNDTKCCLLLAIEIKDLQHLTFCGYGFLKG